MAAPCVPVPPRRAPVLAIVACLAVAVPDSAASALEYAVKATFLYKFMPFIEWPETAFASPTSPLRLCVVGDDPFDDRLDRAVADGRIGPRRIEVRRMPTVQPGSGCHLLYAAGSQAQSVEEALRGVQNEPVVTVTDASREPNAKGIVHFVIVGDRVRFEVDDADAARRGIRISSKVLDLALSVRPRK